MAMLGGFFTTTLEAHVGSSSLVSTAAIARVVTGIWGVTGIKVLFIDLVDGTKTIQMQIYSYSFGVGMAV